MFQNRLVHANGQVKPVNRTKPAVQIIGNRIQLFLTVFKGFFPELQLSLFGKSTKELEIVMICHTKKNEDYHQRNRIDIAKDSLSSLSN